MVTNSDEEFYLNPEITIYPNSFEDQINLVINSLFDEEYIIEVFDNLGRIVYSKKYSVQESNFYSRIDLENLKPALNNL